MQDSFVTALSRPFLAALCFAAVFLTPIALRAALYFHRPAFDWWSADRSSAGLLPPAATTSAAIVRVFAARTVRWRGIFAVHSWIVLKNEGAGAYERYDLTAWGEPIRRNGFVPDGRWFGELPDLIFAADGEAAGHLAPRMRNAIETYPYRKPGDYRAWPGPNSNTFVASVLAAVPEIGVVLPPTAIGKDFPVRGRVLGLTPSRTGIRVSLGGYAGLTLAWIEGVEINLLGGVIGLDLRRPGLKLPAVGRVGI